MHDASDPVPSPVHNAFAFLAEYPDERDLGDRADVLCFTGDVIDAALDLVGPLTFTATVASDGPEMDVFVRVVDVRPDGSAHLVARGQQTLREAGDEYPIEIDLGQVAYRVRPGHRLRLTVASSDAPEFVPAPGSGEHRWLADKTVPNNQRMHLGGGSPARLVLSVLGDHDELPPAHGGTA